MDVSFRTVSSLPVGHDGLPAYQEHSSGPTIDVRVKIPDDPADSPFEFVRIRLQTAVKTQIGTRTAVQKVLNLVEECSWSQFVPLYAPASDKQRAYSAAISFSRPAEKPLSRLSSRTNSLLPATNMYGTTYITKHTALSDQHAVEGRCETHIWVSADFFRHGVLVHSSRSAIELDTRPRLLELGSSKQQPSGPLTTQCRPRMSGVKAGLTSFRKSTKAQSSLQVQLPTDSLIVSPSQLRNGRNCSTVSVPLQVSVTGLSSADVKALLQDGGLRCEVETKWISKHAFTAPTSSTEHAASATVTKRTATTQHSDIAFPPVYEADLPEESQVVSTTGVLVAMLPESAALPTFSSALLQVDYELEFKFLFRLGRCAIYEGKTRTPCTLARS
ncbi:uncharacterized protein HMPREF1541_10466 [Cyphellophora europaea CBS 101466]|uniref:Arrestin-like N-terminal domain-containing protein n=1 Tax=Cyphellophora europaea (strain CBS 101466) TaxID=1220924 RepID=W2S6G0_CYPE1|nr:uncharacterized protein HMPREF1541_10466 [Cyphellophora europaea CBS 101466]ETN44286.1 hypothetical protein HMPREF1541_10466 [Cyphellophora europaea CBS 101466]